MNRRSLIGIGVLVALVIAALATRGFGLFDRESPELRLSGNVDIRQVELAFRVPGRIAEMPVDEGARVSRGSLLARLDPRPLNDAIASADAQVAQADADLARVRNGNRPQDIDRARAAVAEQEARVRKARSDLARHQALAPSGAVSQATLVASRGEYEAALARLREAGQSLSLQKAGSRAEDIAAAAARRQSATAQRDRARTDLADAGLYAPEGGTVLTRAREPGAIVQAGETVFTLTMDRPMRVRAYIAETDLSRISPGMKVKVTADGIARAYDGKIGHIAPAAEFTPKTVQTEDLRADLVYRLRIIVSNPDDQLRQGQPVTILVPDARPARE
jgi:HlyD family secretion protein